MSAIPAPPETVGELLRRLGGISAYRVRFQPLPGTATIKDVAANKLCELIDGVLVEKPMGYTESLLEIYLAHLLSAFLDEQDLGLLCGADGPFQLRKKLVRLPDIAFISWDRLPGRRVPKKAVLTLAPDLAIEVLSPSNTKAEMNRKCRDFFRAGVLLVWLIDPKRRNVRVMTSLEDVTTLTEADILRGEPVLPGFSLPLKKLFAQLDRHG
jgi:Uma2 family endonuclease